MIPSQALELKEYVGGASVSKMADNEHTAASLGHSEELRVQYPPRQTVPELVQRGQQASESLPALDRERSRDVLPHEPSRANLANASNVLEHEP